MKIQFVKTTETAQVPEYKSAGAAGMDLHADLGPPGTKAVIYPGDRILIPTGLRIAIPEGYEGQVRTRSGMALNHGLVVPNSPGTIDSDYRGDLGVAIYNISGEVKVIQHGDRIAQLVIAKVEHAEPEVVTQLDETTRGSGGFGSTGVQG